MQGLAAAGGESAFGVDTLSAGKLITFHSFLMCFSDSKNWKEKARVDLTRKICLRALTNRMATPPLSLINDPAKLLAFCEEFELEGQSQDKGKWESMYCYQLLAHLMLNDTTNARYLWKRIPAPMKKSATVQVNTTQTRKQRKSFETWRACKKVCF